MRKPWIFLIALWCFSCVQFIDADSDLDVAVERFSEPIVRLASGTKPGPGDIRQMMSTLPILLVNIPGVGDVDLKKLNPRVLEHILRGGQIPGLPRDKLDQVVKQYTQKMYEAAVRARANTPIPGDEKYLPPLESLPPEVVTAYMNGRKIPFLDQSQMRMIQEYYTSQIPVEFIGSNSTDGSPSFNPQMFSMLKLLPPNYNLTKIPPEVITQILHGEMPDFAKLPQDILDYLRENSDKMFNSFKISANTSLEEILQKLPRFDPPKYDVTFTPYDINRTDTDLVIKEDGWLTPTQIQILAGTAFGLLVIISCGILGTYIYNHLSVKKTE